MAHYMMDCHGMPDGKSDESSRIVAYNDSEAIREAKNAAIWMKPTSFKVREVKHSGDRPVFDSRTEAPDA